MIPSTVVRSLTLVAALAAPLLARADGLADLKAALARLQASTPLKATLEVRTTERNGEGADASEKRGQASVTLEDGARGLQVLYARDTLASIDAESRQLARDPKARTPTVWALARLDASELVPMASAAQALSRSIDEGPFRSERADSWNGRPARLLTFAVPLTKLPEQQRKYVKDFEATLSVWIAADGTPLASGTHTRIKGRAFVVVGFETVDDTSNTYGIAGDRLLTLRGEHHMVSRGAGESLETRSVKTLQPL